MPAKIKNKYEEMTMNNTTLAITLIRVKEKLNL